MLISYSMSMTQFLNAALLYMLSQYTVTNIMVPTSFMMSS